MTLTFSLAFAGLCQAQSVDPSTAGAYSDFLSGIFGMPLAAAEREQIRSYMDQYSRAGNRNVIKNVNEAIRAQQLLNQQEAGLRAVTQRMTRPDILLGYHQAARSGEAEARYVLDLYYRRNPILAEGKPGGLPLTRDMVEGLLGVKHWMATEIHRQAAPVPDARTVEAAVKQTVAEYARMSAEQQVQLARMPGEYARVRWAWPRASETDRLLTREQMGARLTPHEKAAVQQVLAQFNSQLNSMVSQHQNAMLSGAIRGMQQNSEIIMGRGTVWNPATNRWEQQGGIVTEYNGTVRVP